MPNPSQILLSEPSAHPDIIFQGKITDPRALQEQILKQINTQSIRNLSVRAQGSRELIVECLSGSTPDSLHICPSAPSALQSQLCEANQYQIHDKFVHQSSMLYRVNFLCKSLTDPRQIFPAEPKVFRCRFLDQIKSIQYSWQNCPSEPQCSPEMTYQIIKISMTKFSVIAQCSTERMFQANQYQIHDKFVRQSPELSRINS